MADATTLGLSAAPADESAAADLAAAVASATDTPDAAPETPPVAFGRSWAFDFAAGRFVTDGEGRAREVRGRDSLRVWCGMATNVARFAHPVFSPGFGMDDPDAVVGEAAGTLEVLGDREENLREALSVHDRIVGIESYESNWLYDSGVATESFRVVTDAGEVRFTDASVGSVAA